MKHLLTGLTLIATLLSAAPEFACGSTVEDEIGLGGQAVLVAEGQEADRHPRAIPPVVALEDDRLELVHVEALGVDHLGLVAQLDEQLAIAVDAVAQLVAGQRVPTSALGVAPHQDLVARGEEEDLDVMPRRPEEVDRRAVAQDPPVLAHDARLRFSGQGRSPWRSDIRQPATEATEATEALIPAL